MLASAAASTADQGLVLVDGSEQETRLSWRAIHDRAARFAAALSALGVRPRDRVALVLRTSPALIDSFFGTLLAGAVPVPLYPPVRLGRLAEYHLATSRMLVRTGARLVLTDALLRRLLGQAVAAAQPPLGCRLANHLDSSQWLLHPVAADDLALIQFSSGSTTDPKPVALSHRNLVAQLAALDAVVAGRGEDPPIGVSWLPLYHDMGLIGCLLLAAYHPGTLVLLAPESFLARPALWLRAIARHRATYSPAPNFAYALAARRVRDRDLFGLDLSSWRQALNGAEPITLAAARRFCERFARFGFDPAAMRPVYGLSEASLGVTFTPACRPLRAMTPGAGGYEIPSVGSPMPGVDVAIRDSDGRSLGVGVLGRIFVRGPSVMTGYFGDPAATSRVLEDGWLDTGDLGLIENGELYVHGRAKDVIVIRGANHAAQEFEDCLIDVPGVRAGCSIAVGFIPSGGEGEELAVLAERAAGLVPEDAAVVAAVRGAILERTGIRPHTVELLAPGTLPRTSSGKLRRGEALRRWREGNLSPPNQVGPLRLLAELARSAIAYARLRMLSHGKRQ
jgi:acyl-CoA synthetase (AMP-forming)/AMP-acid ligase II